LFLQKDSADSGSGFDGSSVVRPREKLLSSLFPF
jgi:hypothetical protein